MSAHIKKMEVRNYRSLADLSVKTDSINVLFGPNGAGKSSFLDVIWFVRDCAIRGIDLASSARSHGIGLLYDGADEGDTITIGLSTAGARYELSLGLSSGRIETFPGEQLYSFGRDMELIHRAIGSKMASFYHIKTAEHGAFPLREPQKLALGRYLDFEEQADEAVELDRLLHFVHYYHARSFFLYRIKQQGSEAGYETWLRDRGENLWSVLRNLLSRNAVDDRYDTVMRFMVKSFPAFGGIVLDPTSPTTVYGSFLEKERRTPIRASGVSDGHIQMLLLLVALFGEGQQKESVLLFDEPEISLHPWALSVFAEAVKHAAAEWNKQIFIATHSPVLVSQFEPEQVFAVQLKEGVTRFDRLDEMTGIGDLLEQYSIGSLYVANLIASQGAASQPDLEE